MIRPYLPEDKAKLMELLRLNTPGFFDPSEEKDFSYYLDHLLEHYFVIEENNLVLGCGGINLVGNGKEARISWDIVHPDTQGRGLGSKLTKYRIERIKELPGVDVICVRTTQLVYKFYAKLGFELKEIVKNYWAEGFDLYRMEIKLK